MEELKNVNVNELSTTDVAEHVKAVLALEDKDIKECLENVIDNQYDMDEEVSEPLDLFLATKEFKPFFKMISEETSSENSDEEIVDEEE